MVSKKNESLKNLWILFTIIFLLWLVSLLILSLIIQNPNARGLFGDSFGAINSLFSGFALAGIIYTIFLQKNELRLQRKELELTRTELKRSADAQELSLNRLNEDNRIKYLPYFQYDCIKKKGTEYLLVSNTSPNVAFDIDLWVFFPVHSQDIEKHDFIDKYVEDQYKTSIDLNTYIDFDLYGISDRGIFPSFPSNSLIEIPLNIPTANYGFDLIVQFRDVNDNNYCQKVILDPTNLESVPYGPVEFEPRVPKCVDRFDLSDKNISKESLPTYARWFLELKRASIFFSLLKLSNFLGVENRWKLKRMS